MDTSPTLVDLLLSTLRRLEQNATLDPQELRELKRSILLAIAEVEMRRLDDAA